MGILKEFREFAVKGNAVDLAVGIIIGAAFGKVVSSIVNDLVMPPIGRLMGGLNFNDYFINLTDKDFASLAEAKAAGAATINYGAFITVMIDFVIVAFAVFMLVKAINKLKRKEAAAPPPPPPGPSNEEKLLGEIRDLLRAKA